MSNLHQRKRVNNVLAVTPDFHDQDSLRNILGHTNWRVDCVGSLAQAWFFLHQRSVDVVVTEAVFPDGLSWIDLREEIEGMAAGPALVVACRHLDTRLWTQALHHGAFDVIAKPFREQEVLRVVGLAARLTPAPCVPGSTRSADRAAAGRLRQTPAP